MIALPKDSVVLFQGDSVTDAGRDRGVSGDLGKGYPSIVAAMVGARYPELGLRFFNRGVGGDRTKNLVARWQTDCIDLAPTTLSIMIGINNVWRRYDSNDPTPHEVFRDEYRQLLSQAKQAAIEHIIMLEPFLLPAPAERRRYRDDLDPKIAICRELAAEFKAVYVPLDGIFNAAAIRTGCEYWAPDGVHPTVAGHGLIAEAWLQAVGAA